MLRTLQAADIVGIHVLAVQAKEAAKTFYDSVRFHPVTDRPAASYSAVYAQLWFLTITRPTREIDEWPYWTGAHQEKPLAVCPSSFFSIWIVDHDPTSF